MKKRAKIVSSVERAERKPEAFRMKEKSWTQTPGDCRDYDFLHVSSPPWLFFTIIRISPEEGIFFNEIKKKNEERDSSGLVRSSRAERTSHPFGLFNKNNFL